MLLPKRLWEDVAAGRVTVAVRRWRRPTVRAGGYLRTGAGYLAVTAVEVVEEAELTEDDARRAGAASVAELLAACHPPEPGRRLHRITFEPAGVDPREELRAAAALSAEELAEVGRRLDRLDRAAPAPWTRAVLALIGERPGVVSTDLAATSGDARHASPDGRWAFKADVRKLKALGLTESLPVGYRLSPRGRAVLGTAAGDPDPPPDQADPPPVL